MSMNLAQLLEIESELTSAQKAGFAAEIYKEQVGNAIGTAAASAALAPTVSGEYILAIADAAETNTLANPAFSGQELRFSVASLAGTGTRAITVAAAINATGNTVMTFNAATDTIGLRAHTVGGSLRWRVHGNDGVALS